MLSKETLNEILSLYKKYENDLSLFSSEDFKALINYFVQHPIFSEIKSNRGITILKKLINNMKIKEFQKGEEILKYDEIREKYHIPIFGELKKRNYFKGPRKLFLKNYYLHCIYKCLSNCFFVEIDSAFYIKYILVEQNILLKKFIHKLSKYFFIKELSEYQYQKLFLNYEKRVYKKNEIIYKQGDEIEGIYLIKSGECQILKERNEINPEENYQLISKGINILNENGNGNHSLEIKSHFNKVIFFKNKEKFNCKRKIVKFPPILGKINNKNKILLSIKEGEIFGDLEINRKMNKRIFTVIASSFIQTKLLFFPIKVSGCVLKKMQNISKQKNEIIQTRIEFIEFINKIKSENFTNKNEVGIKIIKDRFHSLNEKKLNQVSFSPANLKTLINEKGLIKEEKNMSTLFLTSPINNNMFQKTKNNDNYNNQSKDLFFTKRNHKNTKNDSSIKNPNNSLHKKTKNYNKIKELNLFRVKKNNFDNLNKKRNSIY